MAATVNVNGRISGEREATISVFDHGFLYGEGVYETLRTYNLRPFLFDRHLRRLRASAAALRLPVPLSDEAMFARVGDTIEAARLPGDAYIRVLLTRGVGELSYDPAACPEPSIVVIVKPHVAPPPEAFARGVAIVMSSHIRNHPGSVSPTIKSNNLLNNAMAMQEAIAKGAAEALMRNYRGELAECSQSNLFIVRRSEALTPPLEAGLLEGITRNFVLEVARDLGISAREEALRDADLAAADEVFITSTTKEVLPVVRVDDRTVGTGLPGPITHALLEGLRKKANRLTSG